MNQRNLVRLIKELKPRKHVMEEMGNASMSQGLITLAGLRMYTSMVDSDEIIDEAHVKLDNVHGSNKEAI